MKSMIAGRAGPAPEAGREPRGAAIAKPYLLFVADRAKSAYTKTAEGVRAWAPDDCTGQWRLSPDAIDLGLPDLAPAEAHAAGARSLLIGIAPIGGQLPDEWVACLLDALEAGLDIVSGLHMRLSEHPVVGAAARRLGRQLHDVRHSDRAFPIASGVRRTGKRLLTVGTDCALGKKYTALAIARALQARGVPAHFRATGQTGIMIAGEGVAIDAVVADFVAGAAETLSPDSAPGHWDVVEGQGAIFHPAYAGVTMGLLHGSQPDALVLCHDPSRHEIGGFPGFPIRPLAETMQTYLSLARVTNPDPRFVGISLNSSSMTEADAHALAARLQAEHGLPVMDPMRFGVDAVVDRMLA